jgi:hypothetical protein
MTKNERLTLTISTFALVVSGLSFLDNHVTVMPKLIVSGPGIAKLIAGDPRVPIWFTITNAGKLDATITEIDTTPFSRMLLDEQDECNKALRDAGTTPTRDLGAFGDLPADHRGPINLYITLPKSCSEIPQEIGVDMVIKYHDFLHIPYTQHELRQVFREKDVPHPSPAK